MLSRLTHWLNAFCVRNAILTVAFFSLLCLGAVWISTNRLGITTETDRLFADSLPWKQRISATEKLFPSEKDTLVAVINAKTPEEGQQTAHQLAEILRRQTALFTQVDEPAASPFYNRNAFLFVDTKTLGPLLDNIIAAQPFLGALAADPSARALFNNFGLIAKGIEHGQDIPESFEQSLAGLTYSLEQASHGHPEPLSWQNLVAGPLGDLGGQYRFVVTHPKRDFSSFEPSEAATRAMRTAINSLPAIQSGRAFGLITGEAKLSDEEFATVAEGMVWGLLLSLALVTLWLILAVRSVRLIIPILITLIFGLLLTTGFAALAVGTLNLISVAFAILFVGIAVDFAIQYGVRFRGQLDENGTSLSLQDALIQTGTESGPQIFVAALATAAGFLAFTPTSFVGVAQLGLIAGIGMMIAFFCTLTLLPALLVLFRARPTPEGRSFHFLAPLDNKIRKYRIPVLAVFGILGLVGLLLTTRLQFDSDPLHTKNARTEGMQALHLLESNPLTTPYNAQIMVPTWQAAQQQAIAFSKLSSVHDVLWLGALVPDDQKTKLALIEDAASILLPGLTVTQQAPAPTAQDLRDSAHAAVLQLDSIAPDKRPPVLKRLSRVLHRLAVAPDTTIMAMNDATTRFLPRELAQLRLALSAGPVTEADIPDSIRADYFTPDKQYRLIIHPRGKMSDPAVLHRFIKQITRINPDIIGPALEITESAHTITHAFTTAAICAVIAIMLILMLVLRRLLDSILVIIPLILSSLLTVILIICVPEPLNYANIIALPLLLGVGVSFNIYFVMNWRAGLTHPLASPTARAVFFSALTTGSAFGSLAASAHPGTASMGRLLLLSLGCTLLCSLIFIPALLPPHPPSPEKNPGN